MIEALLFAAVGFFIAALLALALMSLLWQRAVRLTRENIEASAPTTLREMTAIRDALRAEQAVALCRMEQGLERLRSELTAKTIGYRNAQEELRLARLEATANHDRIRELEEDVAARQARIGVLEENLAKTTQALKDATRAMRETEAELRELEKALDSSENLADSRKVEIAALKTRLNSKDNEIADLQAEIARLRQARQAQGAAATGPADTEDAAASAGSADTATLEAANDRIAELQTRLAQTAAQSARREQQFMELEARLKAYEQSNSAASRAEVNEETAAYLKEKLAQYAAELARFTASVEGPDGRINALIANGQNDTTGSGLDTPLTLADRIRLIAGKTARH